MPTKTTKDKRKTDDQNTPTGKVSKREGESAKKLESLKKKMKKEDESATDEATDEGDTTSSEGDEESSSESSSALSQASVQGGSTVRAKAVVPLYVMAVGETADRKLGAALFEAVEAHIVSFWSEKRRKAEKRRKREKASQKKSKKGM